MNFEEDLKRKKLIHYPLQFDKRNTREVQVGNVGIGGNNPIRIQSMITCYTYDVEACIHQIRELVKVNCEIVRLTIPTQKDLDAVPKIRKRMIEEGLEVPLVADIHFLPQLAEAACELFEKVRINPGNYLDVPKNSKRKRKLNFEEGKEALKESIQPLIKNLKHYDRALRIGVNHGSLSTRMIEEFGDSPRGMVESALEMISLFEEEFFFNIIVSLKSSNPIVAQKAYRLLSQNLPVSDSIPFHLGVTEAGDGKLARIKSLSGIGSLLSDGIGDTIRVSLTEDSKNEVIFANDFLPSIQKESSSSKNLEIFSRSLDEVRVTNEFKGNSFLGKSSSLKIGITENFYNSSSSLNNFDDFKYSKKPDGNFSCEFEKESFLACSVTQLEDVLNNQNEMPVVLTEAPNSFEIRKLYKQKNHLDSPLGLYFKTLKKGDYYSNIIEMSKILSEGLIDFILLDDLISKDDLEDIFLILQATRNKMTATDYIACPSCGRTLFDLQSTTKMIKEKTDHLVGVKIGIMGCIVNGPGEMADADFGYVGSGPGKIDLYLGQQRVKRGVEEKNAVDELIQLIKEHKQWFEPKKAE